MAKSRKHPRRRRPNGPAAAPAVPAAAAAPFVALKIRPGTKTRILRIAGETRLKLADAADVLIEAWDGLAPERQMEIIRRPSPAAAVAS